MMKNVPLSLQIWAVCTGVTLCIFGLIMFFLPSMLNGFFTREVYALLEESQKSVNLITLSVVESSGASSLPARNEKAGPQRTASKKSSGPAAITITSKDSQTSSEDIAPSEGHGLLAAAPADPMIYSVVADTSNSGFFTIDTTTREGSLSATIPAIQIMPSAPQGNFSGLPPVNHLFMDTDPSAKLSSELPQAFMNNIKEQARSQKQTVQRYSHQEGNQTLLYVIRKQNLLGDPGYLLTYAWGSYTRELSSNLTKQLLWLMIALCLVSGIPSLLLARYLTRPLVEMEKAARRISERNWQEALVSGRRDEIGRLARSMEKMRVQLARQDEAQQSFLQNLSHELKTPVMVISSYAQAILDGVYPRGNLEESVKVIQDESRHLQKRIQDFLYLNKLKYLALHPTQNERFALDDLVKDTVERLRWQRPDLTWDLQLTQTTVNGDRQQWAVAIENLLDNQVRYAHSRVEISLNGGLFRVFNDGPPIEAGLLDHIFDPYNIGSKGQFGLGMTIIRQVLEIHGAAIKACNEAGGVAFYIDQIT